MLEAILVTLIYICVAALIVYVILWVLGSIGVPLPPQVVKIIWVIFALVCLILLLRLLLPMAAGGKLLMMGLKLLA